MNNIIIIGTGLAGYTLAREFRKLDKETPLTLITADDGRFYSKPMLSNALASCRSPDSLASSDAAQMAAQLNATVVTHARVTAIDAQQRSVTVNDETLFYEKLVLALGADPVKSTLAGDAVGEALSVNDLQDYAQFHAALQGKKHIAIMGAGLIGCEFANDLISAGYTVDVIDPGQHPLGSLLPKAAGEALQQALQTLGVGWHFGKKVTAINHDKEGYRLSLSDSSELEAHVVLSAIGLKPRVDLAQAAGIKVNRGIIVDRLLMTSAPDIYALGDCAEVGGMVLPFVMPLMQAARALAATLSGTPVAVSYPAMPVVIKTPAYPIILSASPLHTGYEWQTSICHEGVLRGHYYDKADQLQGFVLTGKATAEKSSLLATLPAWL
ncbi:MAG: FAD-dependent oxidoreductase [Gammaproteobacteria bacterium]